MTQVRLYIVACRFDGLISSDALCGRRAVLAHSGGRLAAARRTLERFLSKNGISFRPIPTGPEKTPDYGVTFVGTEIVFEIKEIVSDRTWGDDIVHSGRVGEMIRSRINSCKREIQAAAKEGKPTVLLIYNS